MIKITLDQIKKESPCKEGWEKLLKGLDKTKSDNEEFDVNFILKNNGLDDFCWVLYNVLNKKKELRLWGYWNATQCYKYIPNNEKNRFKKVLNTVNLFAYGKVGDSAWDSARDSARDSAWASAWDSAWDSARDSAWASARASARASAWASARASAWASARASYMKKSEKKLLKILKGNLPVIYKGKNHY